MDPKHLLDALLKGLNGSLLGQETLVLLVVTGILAKGHLLLEGAPGLGKTELVKNLGRLLGLSTRRIQFTADLLPTDITGSMILEEDGGKRSFKFHPGPLFGNVVLADEINRASPRTQSALLEAMAEYHVSVLGNTHALPTPFFVLATQNPIEQEGTFPLPEAQLDRFLFKLHVPRVQQSVLQDIITGIARPVLESAATEADFQRLLEAADQVFLAKAIAGYIARLVDATHPDSPLCPPRLKPLIRLGSSPRGAIAIGRAARAAALIRGQPNVGFEDVKAVASAALNHRILLDYRARLEGVDGLSAVAILLSEVDPVGPLPQELKAGGG
jgi:MoxR-like ATPase